MACPERVPAEAAGRLVRAYASAPAFVAASRAMRAGLVDQVEALSVSVALAWAERHRLVSRPHRDIPGVRMIDLPGCGHIPTWDDPELVVRVILEASSDHSTAVG